MKTRSLLALALAAAFALPAAAQIKIGVTLSTTGPAVPPGIPEKDTHAPPPHTPGRQSAPNLRAETANCADHCGVPQADPDGPAAFLDRSSVSGLHGIMTARRTCCDGCGAFGRTAANLSCRPGREAIRRPPPQPV